MRLRARSVATGAVLVLLIAFVFLGRWYSLRRASPVLNSQLLTVNVVTGSDSGIGSLREALFVADAAANAARITIKVDQITLASALPPLVNPHGIEIAGPSNGVEIDARALGASNPVFDIDAERASLSGLTFATCPGTAILVRAGRFRLSGSSIQSCDVGVEIAGNVRDIAIERNRFHDNRVGVRFTAPSRDSVVARNQFDANKDAGLWVVASAPTVGPETLTVEANHFNGDGTGIVLGNIATVVQQNDFTAPRDSAVHVIGALAVVRNNRISNGSAGGIVVENANGAVIESNELDHLEGYGILLRGSADTLVSGNRIHSCGYGMGFVLGDERRPDTAVDNTLIDLKYNGIDVVGDSPVLRHNQVLQARVAALHVENFTSPQGVLVSAHPLLENNNLQLGAAELAASRDGQARH